MAEPGKESLNLKNDKISLILAILGSGHEHWVESKTALEVKVSLGRAEILNELG